MTQRESLKTDLDKQTEHDTRGIKPTTAFNLAALYFINVEHEDKENRHYVQVCFAMVKNVVNSSL